MSNLSGPVFSHAEPVLAVKDVAATIRYWRDELGFPTLWSWGDPPVLGAVSWHGAYIQFLYEPRLAEASVGNSVWIRLRRVEELYAFHRQRKVEIVDELRVHEFGLAQYSIRDCNGYYIHFAGDPAAAGGGSGKRAPAASGALGFRVVPRAPLAEEFRALEASLGGGSSPGKDVLTGEEVSAGQERLARRLGAVVFGVVAEEEGATGGHGNVIGCALLIGDEASYYYVKDVMVRPEWQRQGVGSAMMRALSCWLDEHGEKGSIVGLICREGLEDFYRLFGFDPVFGMMRKL